MNRPDPMNEKKVQVAYEILQYLIKNPSAQDTLEGIVDWWFLGRTKYPKPLVEKTLEMMVKDGLIVKQQVSDSRTIYKLYRRRRKK
jgi:DNA-binding PadR family transcriptional regulator